VNLRLTWDREEDGRWIAEALEIPGVTYYGETSDAGISALLLPWPKYYPACSSL
jgi:hypothetical protein